MNASGIVVGAGSSFAQRDLQARERLAPAHVGASTSLKYTRYFQEMRKRPNRRIIAMEWITRAVEHPVKQAVQADRRIRRWAPVPEMNGRYLRVVLLPDGETIHNAFVDRSFSE